MKKILIVPIGMAILAILFTVIHLNLHYDFLYFDYYSFLHYLQGDPDYYADSTFMILLITTLYIVTKYAPFVILLGTEMFFLSKTDAVQRYHFFSFANFIWMITCVFVISDWVKTSWHPFVSTCFYIALSYQIAILIIVHIVCANHYSKYIKTK